MSHMNEVVTKLKSIFINDIRILFYESCRYFTVYARVSAVRALMCLPETWTREERERKARTFEWSRCFAQSTLSYFMIVVSSHSSCMCGPAWRHRILKASRRPSSLFYSVLLLFVIHTNNIIYTSSRCFVYQTLFNEHLDNYVQFNSIHFIGSRHLWNTACIYQK